MRLSEYSEKVLVEDLIEGDEQAFCELYARYKHRLIYFAMRFVKSQQYAEDIFQDAFTVVWQSRSCIDPDLPFATYLYTIVRNRVLNQLRNNEQAEKFRAVVLANAIDSTDLTRDQILVNDLNQLISKAKEQLSPRQRHVFELSRDEQLTHKEIAQQLDISVYTVQEHISGSLKIIRSYISKYSDINADLLLLLICLNI